MGEPKKLLVIIEPTRAQYRYLAVAQREFQTLVLTSDPDACLRGEQEYNRTITDSDQSHIDELIKCDTTSSEDMQRALQLRRTRVAGVVAGEDTFISATAKLGAAMGFDYAKPEDALCQHLKTAMKQRLAAHNVRTPEFVVARSLSEAIAAWEGFERNCMLKMVDSTSSMNIYRVATRPDLETAWNIVVDNKRDMTTPPKPEREVIVEEYAGGRELTAEGYVQDDRVVVLNFCEKITESNFVVVGHLLPAKVSPDEEQKLRRIAEECVRALGVHNCVFHVEVHMMDGVPYVIECASRPPGQHMVELMYRSYGFDLMGISIDLATGKKVNDLCKEPKVHYAMLALYSKKSGLLERIEGLDELRSRGGLARLHQEVKDGEPVESLTTFHDKCGFVILEDSSADGVREKATWFRNNVRLIVS